MNPFEAVGILLGGVGAAVAVRRLSRPDSWRAVDGYRAWGRERVDIKRAPRGALRVRATWRARRAARQAERATCEARRAIAALGTAELEAMRAGAAAYDAAGETYRYGHPRAGLLARDAGISAYRIGAAAGAAHEAAHEALGGSEGR
ncbi:hypothetical protein [Candidatus Palauibacter sp.]|uniref:hypothetical protein n=1 Tax=Candidatus Palauibacter sp. TaxID=3101350 RepID=UPI003CC5E129